jgi:Rv2525c-like, glycoside hydrolase-like domain
MIARTRPVALRLLLLTAALTLFGAAQLSAPAGAGARTVHFQGRDVEAPRGWPVYRLAQHPGMCVRLDRRAVYLGRPSPNQSCPAGLIGRRRAILVEPGRTGASASRSTAPRAATAARASVFTGFGFDACSAPSSRTMKAWRASSPYQAIGVYVGGINRACSQPNLTASWVAAQTEAGWHLLPLYVGRQAPSSDCTSCATLSPSQAAAQGAAAAVDAVAQAEGIAIGTGSPIYFDMESYARSSSTTSATLAFLQAWTKKLHALGFGSGVYSSSASGIVDLAGKVGTSYVLPDELWIANWNGQKNTSDPTVPAGAWSPHHRVHQYRGGHNETYGGVTINLDNNYVDGATVGTAALPSRDDPIGRIEAVQSPAPRQVLVEGWGYDPNEPTEPVDVRAYVGGRAGTEGALEYELGLAQLARPEVAVKHPAAGEAHGFESSFPTTKSGPQQVCLYATDLGPGSDRLLGCRTIGIPVAIALSAVRATRRGVFVRISCEWPAGSGCAGQLRLRTRIEVALPHRRGHRVRLRRVRRSLAGRAFRLGGGRSHAFLIPLSRAGRELLRERGHLRAQLIAAIPGGKRSVTIALSS